MFQSDCFHPGGAFSGKPLFGASVGCCARAKVKTSGSIAMTERATILEIKRLIPGYPPFGFDAVADDGLSPAMSIECVGLRQRQGSNRSGR
jgi:hypothetical protein